ncbi:MAG: hypothetical protein WC831_04360 [Parcubacteria group bacterium]
MKNQLPSIKNQSISGRQNLGAPVNRQNGTFYIKISIFLILLIWLGVFMANKVDLATADLGRHLENGKWLVGNHFNLFEKNSPVHENFYSYTNSDFPVVNHHWGSGVLFYFIYKLFGFTGLSLFYIIFSLAIFAMFFQIARQKSNFTAAALLSLLLIPLMAERGEIRPEIFSYFFAGVFFWALLSWQEKKLATSRLFALPILMILWVNLHVYFFAGLFIIGVFWLSGIGQLIFSKLSDEEFSEKARGVKSLTIVLFLSALGSLINPFGIKGLLYPFQIFKNYGYTIVENKSVSFVESYGIVNSNFFLIKVVLIFLLLSFVLLFFADRKKISFSSLVFAVFFGTMGWLAIRNLTLLGFFALPVLAENISGIFSLKEKERNPAQEDGLSVLYIFIFVFAAIVSYQFISLHSTDRGIGLLPENEKAAEFFRKENIKGPVFNNYDIGGYLIWNLYPQEKVFVDNRPEAYPDSFFSEVYKPMQDDPAVFEKIDKEYDFNAIFFYRNDITPWGVNFQKAISKNSQWKKAYEDDFASIYIKRDGNNKPLIEQ